MFSTYLSRGLFKPRLIFARINGPIDVQLRVFLVLNVDSLGTSYTCLFPAGTYARFYKELDAEFLVREFEKTFR